MVKNLPANVGDTGDAGLTHGLGRSPGVGNGKLLQGCSPWGCRESDATEHVHTHTELLGTRYTSS